MFDKIRALFGTKPGTAPDNSIDGFIRRLGEDIKGDRTAPAAQIIKTFLKSIIQELSADGRMRSYEDRLHPILKSAPDMNADLLRAILDIVEGVLRKTERGNSFRWPITSVEDLVPHLQFDFGLAIDKLALRKIPMDDTLAARVARQFGTNEYVANLNILNRLIKLSIKPGYVQTQQALLALKQKFASNKHDLHHAGKIFRKLSQAFPDETTPPNGDEFVPPNVKWLTQNSLIRITTYYEKIDSPRKVTSDHIGAIKRWMLIDPQANLGAQKLRYNAIKVLLHTTSNPVAKRLLEEELDDLRGPSWLTWNHAFSELQPILQILEKLKALDEEDAKTWFSFAAIGNGLAASGPPSKKWLNELESRIGTSERKRLLQLLKQVALVDDWPPRVKGAAEAKVRSMIYATVLLDKDPCCTLISNFAEKTCFKTIPNLGIANEKLGNACLWALSNRKDGAGVAYLSRLLTRIKYPKVRKVIAAALDEAAAKAGTTRGELEEQSVPTHGLDEHSTRDFPIGPGLARLRIAGTTNVEITWSEDKAKFKSTIPTKLKEHQKQIQAVRTAAKEIQTDLSVQVTRFQRIWLDNRSWAVGKWLTRYANHPVLSGLTRRLIWNNEISGRSESFIWHEGSFRNLNGQAINLTDGTISLWHPVECKLKDVQAWRKRVREIGVIQPFKQAHREIYIVTPAELNTSTYSNRFAGHILKQHQMVALARLNSWNVTLRIAADAPNDAPTHLVLPAHGFIAEYWTEAAGLDDNLYNDALAYLYLTTDRVCFYKYDQTQSKVKSTAYGPTRGEVVPIKDVPPLILSEVMRHCDLFVGVASVANDQNWRDGGANQQHPNQWQTTVGADYWTKQSFGELDQASKLRSEFLAEILPALAIGQVCRIEGRFLHVKGKLRKYKIHMGSGNILMEPNDAYLCIVPSSTTKGEVPLVSLPFEGDSKLSIVLSKAILLADDDKITDQTILQQIRMK
jgi:hypothetical protein